MGLERDMMSSGEFVKVKALACAPKAALEHVRVYWMYCQRVQVFR